VVRAGGVRKAAGACESHRTVKKHYM
jgi:hypothetical protein